MADVSVTELTDLDVDEVHLVSRGANGFPALLLKSVQDEVEAAKADPGGFHATDTESPEADVIEDDLTTGDSPDEGAKRDQQGRFSAAKERARAQADADFVAWVEKSGLDDAVKARLTAAERHALPDSDFAYIDSKGGRHLPVQDEDHVRAALGRFNEQHFESKASRRKAARKIKARAKELGIKLGSDTDVAQAAAKSPGVPDFATATPQVASTLTTEAKSGLGPQMTAGVRDVHSDPSLSLGGQTPYRIPAEARQDETLVPNLNNVVSVRPDLTKGEDDEFIHIIEKAPFLSAPAPTVAQETTPGSPSWEDYDAATLDSVAQGLAACGRAVDAIRQREAIEAVSGNPSDWEDAADLGSAGDAIDCALAFVARLAYHEASAGAKKSGRRLSAASEAHLRAAHDHLTALLGDGHSNAGQTGTEHSEEETIMATVTKEELFTEIATAAKGAAKQAVEEFARTARKQARKEARKQRKAAERATKNANNGGDISAEEMERQVRGHASASDVNAIPDGGHTDMQYVNASNDPRGSASKGGKDGKALKAIAAQLRETRELVEKMASRPRSGGPILDGVVRGAFPASEQRSVEGPVAKSATQAEIERLEKAIEATTDPVRRDEFGQQLTYQRLLQAHEQGLI